MQGGAIVGDGVGAEHVGLEPVRRYNCLIRNSSSRGILPKMRQMGQYKKGVSRFPELIKVCYCTLTHPVV